MIIELSTEDVAMTLATMSWVVDHSKEYAPKEWTDAERLRCNAIRTHIANQLTPEFTRQVIDNLKIMKEGDDS